MFPAWCHITEFRYIGIFADTQKSGNSNDASIGSKLDDLLITKLIKGSDQTKKRQTGSFDKMKEKDEQYKFAFLYMRPLGEAILGNND